MQSTHTDKYFVQLKKGIWCIILTPNTLITSQKNLGSSRKAAFWWECMFHASLSCMSVLSLCVPLWIHFGNQLSQLRGWQIHMDPPPLFISPIIHPSSPSLRHFSCLSLQVIYRTAVRHQLHFLWAACWREPGCTVTGGCALHFTTVQGTSLLVEKNKENQF